MILDQQEEAEVLEEISEDYSINEADGTNIKIYEKGIAGQTDFPCLCAKYDENDDFIGKYPIFHSW
jgi:hypothetical protein